MMSKIDVGAKIIYNTKCISTVCMNVDSSVICLNELLLMLKNLKVNVKIEYHVHLLLQINMVFVLLGAYAFTKKFQLLQQHNYSQ